MAFLSYSSWLDFDQQQSADCSKLYGAGRMQTSKGIFHGCINANSQILVVNVQFAQHYVSCPVVQKKALQSFTHCNKDSVSP